MPGAVERDDAVTEEPSESESEPPASLSLPCRPRLERLDSRRSLGTRARFSLRRPRDSSSRRLSLMFEKIW